MHRRLFQLSMALMLAVLAAVGPAAQPAVAVTPLCYVDADGTPPGSGATWLTAYTDLQSALTNPLCEEIWVAEGTYTPGASRGDTFEIPPGVGLYGGFDGTESSFIERDWVTHSTILSGEIGAAGTGDNVYHVVTIDGTDYATEGGGRALDGLTITAGRADGGGASEYLGGGLFCNGSGPHGGCSPVMANLTFSYNYAIGGGGLFVDGSNGGNSQPDLYDVSFFENNALVGAGIYNNGANGGIAEPSLVRVTFDGNYAEDGGGMVNDGSGSGYSSPDLYNVTFHDNDAVNHGGAMYNYADGGTSSPTLTNVTFSGNDADYGGAIYNDASNSGTSNPHLVNVILWGNTAGISGPQVYNLVGTGTISYSLVQGGCGSITGADCTDTHNLSTNPMLGPLADNGGETKTMALLAGSSAMDAGDDATCAAPDVNGADQRRVRRPQGPHCDIGAFEVSRTPTDFQGDGMTEPAKYVSSAGAVYYYLPSEAAWGSEFIGTDGEYVLNSDLDGDGQTDPAKYVAAAGAIWYVGSADDSWHGIYIGSDGDFIPGSDFDGDGRTDPAKYVAAAGAVWYLGSADSTWYGVYIGDLGGGVYIPGSDFDGDGKTDPAKYVAGGVYWRQSSTGTWASQYIGSDGPYVPRSDYDGDGKADPAKFVSPNIWYLQSDSAYALTTLSLGADTTFVVPGSDFDGDGITDPAKFVDAADAIWYTRSSNGWDVGVYMGADTYDIVN